MSVLPQHCLNPVSDTYLPPGIGKSGDADSGNRLQLHSQLTGRGRGHAPGRWVTRCRGSVLDSEGASRVLCALSSAWGVNHRGDMRGG